MEIQKDVQSEREKKKARERKEEREREKIARVKERDGDRIERHRNLAISRKK